MSLLRECLRGEVGPVGPVRVADVVGVVVAGQDAGVLEALGGCVEVDVPARRAGTTAWGREAPELPDVVGDVGELPLQDLSVFQLLPCECEESRTSPHPSVARLVKWVCVTAPDGPWDERPGVSPPNVLSL